MRPVSGGVGLFALLFGCAHAETAAWSSPLTIGSLAVGAVLLVLFGVFETRTRHPLLPPRVVVNRIRGGSLIVMLFGAVGIFGVFLFLTYYLQATLGFSPVRTGLAFLPLIGSLSVVAQISNRTLLPRLRPRVIVPMGLLICSGASFGLTALRVNSSYSGHVLPYLLLLGIGSGLSVAPAFSTGTLGLIPQDAGVGSATLNTAQQVGGSIGTALLNTLVASAASTYLASHTVSLSTAAAAAVHGDTTAFQWSGIAYIVAAVLAVAVLPRGSLGDLQAGQPTDHLRARHGRSHVVRLRIACR